MILVIISIELGVNTFIEKPVYVRLFSALIYILKNSWQVSSEM